MASKNCMTNLALCEIEKTIQRGEKLDGIYSWARFEFRGKHYYMDSTGNLWVWLPKKLDWKYICGGRCRRDKYHQYSLSNVQIKSYVLSMLCLTDNFLDKYLSGDCVVNHMVIDVDGAPNVNVERDPRYLECVDSSSNVSHGSLIRRYGLYNTRVSAADVRALETLFLKTEDMKPKAIVSFFYGSRTSMPVEVASCVI